jgi:hypothetical protein
MMLKLVPLLTTTWYVSSIACPTVPGGEGCHGPHVRRLAWHGHSALGHVNNTVEVMAPLRPQLWPGVHTWRVVEDDMRDR